MEGEEGSLEIQQSPGSFFFACPNGAKPLQQVLFQSQPFGFIMVLGKKDLQEAEHHLRFNRKVAQGRYWSKAFKFYSCKSSEESV